MTLSTARSMFSVPRASGDKPNFLHCSNRLHNVFPAPAGINRTQPRFPASPLRVPRASGDKPAKKYGWMRQKKCSPLQRG
ncbi:hypothetical protein ECP030477710_2979 [Escherichia coli P0304777.10]|nr:hypothetical protein ECP030477710_2979 [Escherichia coli P0304777.10]